MAPAKTRTTRRGSGVAAERPDPDVLLAPLATDELQLLCARLNLEVPTEREACLDAIKGLNENCNAHMRMQKTKKFASQLALWRDMVARGMEPTLERMELLWLHDLEGEDALRLLCTYAGVDASGTRAELLERLETVRNIKGYKASIGTPLWDYHMANLQAYLATNPSALSKDHAWLRLLDEDGLRLMCKTLGISIDGNHDALFERLATTPSIDLYRGYVGCSWWKRAMEDREELARDFARYKPDQNVPVQRTTAMGPADVDRAARLAQNAKDEAALQTKPEPEPELPKMTRTYDEPPSTTTTSAVGDDAPVIMTWLDDLSTKRLLLVARDLAIDTRVAVTREDLLAAIRASPNRDRLLRGNVESDAYEEQAAKRHKAYSTLANTTEHSALYDNVVVDITMHWMAGRPPPGVTEGTASHSACLRGKSVGMLPLHTAVQYLKEQFAHNVPGVSADSFRFWYVPDLNESSCILAWRPDKNGPAFPLSDYARVGDVLPHDHMKRKHYDCAVLVAVPKALSDSIKGPDAAVAEWVC